MLFLCGLRKAVSLQCYWGIAISLKGKKENLWYWI